MAKKQMTPFEIEVTECLAAIKRGDETQYDRLCELTYSPLQYVAKKYLYDKSLCRDVVSEVYINIIKYIKKYNPRKNGYNYLWQIVKRKAYDCNDDYKRQTIINVDIVGGSDNNNQFENTISQIDLELALKVVGHINTSIIMWTYQDDMTQEEIGDLLQMTKSAVNQRLKKSMEKLSNYYKKH